MERDVCSRVLVYDGLVGIRIELDFEFLNNIRNVMVLKVFINELNIFFIMRDLGVFGEFNNCRKWVFMSFRLDLDLFRRHVFVCV